jgi:hypothetical protein
MANALYDLGRNKFARGEIIWKSGGDTIRMCLVKAAYTPNLATHEFFTDLGANVIGNSGSGTRANCPALTLSDPAAGVCDASDVTMTAVTGTACNYIAIFKDSGADATSPLIALIDTATGLPIAPNGGNINITWDNGSNKIFKL